MTLQSRVGARLEERLALMAPARRLRLALEQSVLAEHAQGGPIRVLEVGCGDGLLAISVAAGHPEWSIVGVDLREDLLAMARSRARRRGVANVEFAVADVARSLPGSGYDAVAAIECLSEIPDDDAALGAMVAALRPGGLLVVHVPDRDWKPVFHGSAPTWREQVRQGYSAASIAELLARAGLEQVTVRPTYRSLAAGAQEVRDRIKERSVLLRALAYPAMVAAAGLEYGGVSIGPANALLAVARRPLDP